VLATPPRQSDSRKNRHIRLKNHQFKAKNHFQLDCVIKLMFSVLNRCSTSHILMNLETCDVRFAKVVPERFTQYRACAFKLFF
jgi:hypothetical protein